MNVVGFARAWAAGWAKGWETHDPALVGTLYAENATFRSHPHRPVSAGAEGATAYAAWAFEAEANVRCWFAEPHVAAEDRAAVEYWAISTDENDAVTTISGVTLLRFQEDGRVVEHRDYWCSSEGALEPYREWAMKT